MAERKTWGTLASLSGMRTWPLTWKLIATAASQTTFCKQVFATPQTESWPVHPVMNTHHLGQDDE
jgi:hypothetical protein